jgi:capsule biosynthesis phosphatase
MDMDGTICEDTDGTNYKGAAPRPEVIRRVNKYWQDGWEVIIFTARGMRSFNGDLQIIEMTYRKLTEHWLKENRVMYDKLIFGKPSADLYVDDKAIDPDEFASRNT